MKNRTIGVLFGGRNTEHEISIITGEFVLSKLREFGYKAEAVYIDRNGKWYISEELSELNFFKENYEEKLKTFPEFFLNLTKSQSKLVLERKKLLSKNSIVLDYIFPTFHGLNGEDGTIQGLAEFFNVPYAGCGIYSSSVAINKILTKKLLLSLNIPTTKFINFSKYDIKNDKKNILEKIKTEIGIPLFVKPALGGSSIGISKVKNYNELEDALNMAMYYDTQIIVEQSVENIVDLTCSVLSNGKEIVISEIQESLFDDDLFDFNSKYEKDGGIQTGNAESNLVIPANINDKTTNKIKEYVNKIFREINGNGTMRIDFLFNKKNGELYANEINTLPGTLYHHLWKKSGVNFIKVLDYMLLDGMNRWNISQELNSDFKTNVLNNANSLKLKK